MKKYLMKIVFDNRINVGIEFNSKAEQEDAFRTLMDAQKNKTCALINGGDAEDVFYINCESIIFANIFTVDEEKKKDEESSDQSFNVVDADEFFKLMGGNQ